MSRTRLSILLLVGATTLLTWFASFALVIWFLASVWPSRVGIVIGSLVLLGVLLVRPRLPKLPAEHQPVRRDDCPELFRLLDRIADQVGAPNVDILAFDASINAKTLRVGLRRRLAIVIGFPLWEALAPEERVALLAHELGHEVNGDLWRSPIIGSSIGVLTKWHQATLPGSFEDASRRGLTGVMAWVLLTVPHIVFGTLQRLQHRLSLESHRQSEFGADESGAEVAGTKAMLALFDRFILSASIDYVMQQSARSGAVETGVLWTDIRQRFVDLPDHERKQIRQTALAEETSTDSTHPATGQRIVAMKALAFHNPTLLLDHSQSAAVDRELTPARDSIEPVVLRNAISTASG